MKKAPESIRLIAFDLDGTLLDDRKGIPEINLSWLRYAHDRGIYIVPATGRLPSAIPEELKEICRYVIAINGALVYDRLEEKAIYEAYIPYELGLELYDYAKKFDCIYDAYINSRGLISRSMYDVFEDYTPDKFYAVIQKQIRTPLESLDEYVRENRCDIQKIQFYFKDIPERDRQLDYINSHYSGRLCATTSLPSNIEINSAMATKGAALKMLCSRLGVSVSEAVGFGDGLNDLSMLTSGCFSVAMNNGAAPCIESADLVAPGNNDGGVGQVLKTLFSNSI